MAGVILDLALMFPRGEDHLADVAVVRSQPWSPRPRWPLIRRSRGPSQLAADATAALTGINTARAPVRRRAWPLAGDHARDHGADAGNPLIVDLDATLVRSHSDKNLAAQRSAVNRSRCRWPWRTEVQPRALPPAIVYCALDEVRDTSMTTSGIGTTESRFRKRSADQMRKSLVKSSQSGNASGKVLAVLDALVMHRRLSDIATSSGLAKSTVHRILQTMVQEVFATVDGSGYYVPGPRLIALAGRVVGRLDAFVGADATLGRLQQSTGATVHLAVLSGDEAIYVRKLEPSKPYRMASRVGTAIPLHCTSIGKAYLSLMPRDYVEALAERTGLPRCTPNTLTSIEALLANLDEVRERGWAIDDEENEKGVFCVGAAVRDHTGHVTAAVSVTQLRSDPAAASVDVIGPLVAKAGAEVSAGLGAP